jgi:hypothetical protein
MLAAPPSLSPPEPFATLKTNSVPSILLVERGGPHTHTHTHTLLPSACLYSVPYPDLPDPVQHSISVGNYMVQYILHSSV